MPNFKTLTLEYAHSKVSMAVSFPHLHVHLFALLIMLEKIIWFFNKIKCQGCKHRTFEKLSHPPIPIQIIARCRMLGWRFKTGIARSSLSLPSSTKFLLFPFGIYDGFFFLHFGTKKKKAERNGEEARAIAQWVETV